MVSGAADVRRQVPRMAGKQFGVLSASRGESLEAARPAGDEGMDWVMVVGKRAITKATGCGPTAFVSCSSWQLPVWGILHQHLHYSIIGIPILQVRKPRHRETK